MMSVWKAQIRRRQMSVANLDDVLIRLTRLETQNRRIKRA